MTYSLLWLPDVLRAAGLDVVLTPGWETRGHDDVRDIQGVMCHHTCGPKTGDIEDLGVLIAGRPDLEGPLCELGLARSGIYHVVAAGKPWHAGAGNWKGITDGNMHMIGIEAENTGLHDDPWPEPQLDAYARGVAAILIHIGASPSMCCGHKEYALPKGRKDDPSFDMDTFRGRVAVLMMSGAAGGTISGAVRGVVGETSRDFAETLPPAKAAALAKPAPAAAAKPEDPDAAYDEAAAAAAAEDAAAAKS